MCYQGFGELDVINWYLEGCFICQARITLSVTVTNPCSLVRKC